ncbi:MAG: alpha-galactosidase, partial [Lentisphaeria bacterium]|nr:alpha-galactosidase [Lentisphaeria bacterium]
LTHRHVREKIVPQSLTEQIKDVEICHRGYWAGDENTADILDDIKLAKESGIELYMIDAGWFGKDPAQWYSSAGDWQEGAWMKDGGGLRTLAKTAHSLGMKFGLWIEAEAAGEDTEIFKNHPNWRLHRNGSIPVGRTGRALDLTRPEVYDHVKNTIAYWISELELDMFRLDHNHLLVPEPNRMYRGYREGLIWRYYEAFYRMITELREQFPDVMFQNCATGGGRLDWKTISLFHNSEITDCTVEPQQFKILNGVTMSIPPEFLLSRVGLKEKSFDMDAGIYDLARGMSRLNIRGIAKKKETLGPYFAGEFFRGLRAYKEIFRNLLKNGKLWHHTPFLPLDGAAPWCALECSSPDGSASYAVIMRCRHGENDTFTFYPRGIDPNHTCRVQLLVAKQEFTISGSALLQNGIRVTLDAPMMAETIVFNTINTQ